MEAGPMNARPPMRRCALCGIVPPRPYLNAETEDWGISCPCCDRTVWGRDEDEARERWAEANSRPAPNPDRALDLLDAIEAAMCDLEAIRTVPGAMSAWHDWMDALGRIRRAIEEVQG